MELATVPAVHPHMCGDSVKASMSDCWCWATEMTVGGLLDSHHYLSLVTAWKAELPLFFLSPFSLCGHPPPHPHRTFWNAIMDQWAPPSVVLLVNIYWVEQQPLPSLERGALQSLGAILCLCVYIRVCASQLFLSFHSPLSCCKRAATFLRHEHVEVHSFTVAWGCLKCVLVSVLSVRKQLWQGHLGVYRHGRPGEPAADCVIEASCL